MQPRHGLLLLVLLLLAFFAYDIGRHALVTQSVPTFFVESRPDIQIALEGDWDRRGIYQFSDGSMLLDVINLTGLERSPELQMLLDNDIPVVDGERYILQVVKGGVVGLSRDWMPAAQRVALGISLHPDRMTEEDWDYLPGVGQRMAAVIEEDRQKNGDFLSWEPSSGLMGSVRNACSPGNFFLKTGNYLKNRGNINIIDFIVKEC